MDVVTHRTETLSLLTKRLGDPNSAVNDVTLTAVARYVGQVILCNNVKETKLHMDGLERMLALNPDFEPSCHVREMLFWTDLTAAALCHESPRLLTTRPNIRLYGNPLLLVPRSTIAIVCRGFQKIIAAHEVFKSITDILHDLRCLTAVAHYSDCKAHIEMPIFAGLCFAVDERLGSLLATEESTIFESCRLAAMIFVEVVLLRNNTSNAVLLAAGIKRTLSQVDMEVMLQQHPELLTWILYMGNMAAHGTEMAPWFLCGFAQAVSFQKISLFETVRSVLIEFLWLDGVSNEHLWPIWRETREMI
ncbi:hypothetical protein VE03_06900 [Pseudogymnoascus sp. 23342-1-I1]|nr:hypothetical protein VE03_06900 [Pseudogymnoascus sp. 23342-1-I1]